MNPFSHTGLSISDSLKSVRKSVLIYETIIVSWCVYLRDEFEFHGSFNMNSEEYIRLSETASIQSQPVALVSEKEYEYGADAFEIYMKENKEKIKPEMKEVAVQKNEKAR